MHSARPRRFPRPAIGGTLTGITRLEPSKLEIVDGVHAIPGISWSRAYLIEDETLALVDAGLPWNVGAVLRYIESIGRKPEELSTILITHSHPDHTSGVPGIVRRTHAGVLAHASDTKAHRGDEVTLSYMGVFSGLKLPLPFLERTPATALSDGDELPLLGGVRVIHTPGHTPGSVCYLVESRGLLFSGDTVFSDGASVSRSVPFPGYDGVKYRESIERLAGMPFDTLCGGHGEPLVGGASDRLRDLLKARPDPPTWRGFLQSVPGRLLRARGVHGEGP